MSKTLPPGPWTVEEHRYEVGRGQRVRYVVLDAGRLPVVTVRSRALAEAIATLGTTAEEKKGESLAAERERLEALEKKVREAVLGLPVVGSEDGKNLTPGEIIRRVLAPFASVREGAAE